MWTPTRSPPTPGSWETSGGRRVGPVAPHHAAHLPLHDQTLARQLGRRDVAAGVNVPRHKAGPPETLSEIAYENVLRVPDRRSVRGTCDYALLRVLGDCGLRSAELRGLVARDLRQPRTNARHLRLLVRGKGAVSAKSPCLKRPGSRWRRGWPC